MINLQATNVIYIYIYDISRLRVKFKFFATTQPSQSDPNVSITLPYKYKTQPIFSDSSPLLRTPYSPLSITLPFALPNALPCFPAYLCQKDERALRWNFRSCKFFVLSSRNNNNNNNNNNNSCNTVFPRDMVCLRNISVDTLHKGDTEDNNNNNNNNNVC